MSRFPSVPGWILFWVVLDLISLSPRAIHLLCKVLSENPLLYRKNMKLLLLYLLSSRDRYESCLVLLFNVWLLLSSKHWGIMRASILYEIIVTDSTIYHFLYYVVVTLKGKLITKTKTKWLICISVYRKDVWSLIYLIS